MRAGRTSNDANLAKESEIFPPRHIENPDKKAPETKDAPANSQQSGTIL